MNAPDPIHRDPLLAEISELLHRMSMCEELVLEIPLTRGFFALVDSRDFPHLCGFDWCESGGYAVRGGEDGNVRMHREIMGLKKWDRRQVDHVDGDPLNNCRSNLRICTAAQNAHNTGPRRNNTSGFKGVTADKSSGGWQARIKAHGKRHNLGVFKTPEAAHEAYCKAAEEMHGAFSNSGISTRRAAVSGRQMAAEAREKLTAYVFGLVGRMGSV